MTLIAITAYLIPHHQHHFLEIHMGINIHPIIHIIMITVNMDMVHKGMIFLIAITANMDMVHKGMIFLIIQHPLNEYMVISNH
jgi:hypothetical protein